MGINIQIVSRKTILLWSYQVSGTQTSKKTSEIEVSQMERSVNRTR
jgi:hypothetical protein